MKIAVVGGALQGLEVAYLARKAGFRVLLVDRRSPVPASGLCHAFRQADVTDETVLDLVLRDAHLVFPALESPVALDRLHAWALKRGIPMIHDPRAYAVSSSKIASEGFFRSHDIPIPSTWPGCRFPVIAKPSYGSGSQGIRIFDAPEELHRVVGSDPAAGGWIVQEFVSGPAYSVEVIRQNGLASAIQVTDLHMDARYDCKRVTAPSRLPAEAQGRLGDLALRMADALGLEGIMDVEAVLHDGRWRVLEIDARFPSQTPIAVHASCGINMVETLVAGALEREVQWRSKRRHPVRGAVLEHIRVTPGRLEVTGEHAIACARSLSVHPDFFGADEAITDVADERQEWVATLICTGGDLMEARARRDRTVAAICRRWDIRHAVDPSPARDD
ncbi:MAG: 3-methylornithine--L-lysine ligase PylC [Desulfobacterales bacterium]